MQELKISELYISEKEFDTVNMVKMDGFDHFDQSK